MTAEEQAELNRMYKHLEYGGYYVKYVRGRVHLMTEQWPDGLCTVSSYPFEGTFFEAIRDGYQRIYGR